MKRGEFYWPDDTERNKYKTMQSLIKTNAGKFKSDKQAAFIKWNWAELRNESELKRLFGIIKNTSSLIVRADGIIQHSIIGGRSLIPYTIIYILDDEGIVASWRVHYKGNLRDGAKPDPERTELIWKRDLVAQTA